MPGQAYESGIGFIQNYFGQPLALIVVCAVFVPIYQRLKVYTAYQYLGERFDRKTQLLGAFLFLVQRGIAAGITIYAPAIILSALVGWRLNLTIWLAGGLVIIYTVVGGTKIVSITQRYQMVVILIGMAIAFAVAVYRLSPDLSFGSTLPAAGKMGKLEAVDFSVDPHKRCTCWSGLIGGFFLALSYFGPDQSQVQRYLAGGPLKESRLGLLFNGAVKVPKQFFILQQMPHGLVGLLIAVILCATMSAMAATLNALGSTTAIDFYRPLIRPNASDHHYVVAAKALTAAWGLIAIGVASFASLVENLIEAGNILGSIFYGSILGLFLAAFFIRRVTGSAVFFAALIAQALVFVLFATTNIGYLWYNFIGCAAVLILAPVLQQTISRGTQATAGA